MFQLFVLMLVSDFKLINPPFLQFWLPFASLLLVGSDSEEFFNTVDVVVVKC